VLGTIVKVGFAVVVGWAMLKFGIGLLRGMGQPLPPPPPPGELRKVSIRYRCSVCGLEIRTTLANDQEPAPPRHCMEEMDVLVPVD
jgi:hypothetical protein